MASVERIEHDIAELTKTVAALATELEQAYADYLQALGQAVRQQLVLSGYHACTQGYPSQFLALSLGQRQVLQQDLRSLANQTQVNLHSLLHSPATESETTTPTSLTAWQEALETAIAHEFHVASQAGNRLLQQAKIVPNKLPEFLQATSRSELFDAEALPADLLNLLEADGNASDDEINANPRPIAMIQLVAINVQLAEVEFADANVTVLRNRLRSLVARLKTLRQQYRKKERELAIARAQDAWRASWQDD